MVRGIEKLKEYLKMSCKNEAKPHIFIGGQILCCTVLLTIQELGSSMDFIITSTF
jgi:hypothetical protein